MCQTDAFAPFLMQRHNADATQRSPQFLSFSFAILGGLRHIRINEGNANICLPVLAIDSKLCKVANNTSKRKVTLLLMTVDRADTAVDVSVDNHFCVIGN